MTGSRLVGGAGVRLSCREAGAGASVLVIHGIASDAQALAPLIERLAAAGRRAIAYDRRGYGASDAPEPYEATTVEEQSEDAAALLSAIDAAPALVVGDGFGALIALDLLKRHRSLVRAAVLSDPPLFAFVPDAAHPLSDQRVVLENALRAGGPERAVEVWLAGRADPASLERAKAAHRAFFADYAGLASWPVTRAELRAMDLPAAVLTSPATPEHVLAAADALAALLPQCVRLVDGDLAGAALGLG